MTSRTAWVAGNGQGLTYGTLINSSDLASMVTGSTVLSTVADIANGSNLDMFMDISLAMISNGTTFAAGSNFALFKYDLNQDSSHYGDNQLTAGTQAGITPASPPIAIVNIPALTAGTANIFGTITGIVIPPGSFRFALQNNSGTTISSGTQTVKFRTYNINLNS